MSLTPRLANRLAALEAAHARAFAALQGDNPATYAVERTAWLQACSDVAHVARAEGRHGMAAAFECVTDFPR